MAHCVWIDASARLAKPYRFRVLDDSDPRVPTGIEISKHRIVRMGQHLASEGIEFAAVMLPTKESVFFPRVDTPQEHKDLTKLAVAEARLREEVTRFLREEGIFVIDPTQALQQVETQPYFTDADGHPNSIGHKVIASVIAAELRTSFSTD